ncbi:MAG TPA: 2-dehydropantoate 2-reductase [Chthoniobacterales bacterium]|jgi:2-dehydropantoate 2-reductase
MKIAIVGSGAIGSYYGARLLDAGNDVRFLMRSDLETVRKSGLQIISPDGDLHLHNVPAFGSTAEIGEVDLVIIALKTTANDALRELLPPLLGSKTMLLTLQNGFGNEEFLASHFGEERVLGGLCFVCLTRTASGVIEHYGHGSVAVGEAFGPSTPRAKEVAEAFRTAKIQCRLAESIPWERWRKLLWNIPFNGLSIAAGKATVEDLLASPELKAEVEALMEEVRVAAEALGFKLDADLPASEIARSLEMGPYRPSSLIDFERGNAVEVEAIWGEPLRRAHAAGVRLPRLEMLTALLQRIAA